MIKRIVMFSGLVILPGAICSEAGHAAPRFTEPSRLLVDRLDQVQRVLQAIVDDIQREQPRVSSNSMEIKQEVETLLKSLEQGKIQAALSDMLHKEISEKIKGANEAQKQLDAQLQEIVNMVNRARAEGRVPLEVLQAQQQALVALDRIVNVQTSVDREFGRIIEQLKGVKVKPVAHESAEEKFSVAEKQEASAVASVATVGHKEKEETQVVKEESVVHGPIAPEAKEPPIVSHEMQGLVEVR